MASKNGKYRAGNGAAAIPIDELPPEVLARLGVGVAAAPEPKQKQARKGKQTRTRRAAPKEQIRSHALRILAELADLSQQDRRRVLEQALLTNDV